jgi:hypothetical protein
LPLLHDWLAAGFPLPHSSGSPRIGSSRFPCITNYRALSMNRTPRSTVLPGPRAPFVLAALIGSSACSDATSLELPDAVTVTVPAAAGAALPHVHGSAHGLILSWVQPADSGHVLLFSRWTNDSLSPPLPVAQGDDWFVNWADFPSVIALGERELAAHWLQRSGPGTYAYDVMISRSTDAGATWSPGVRPHTDDTRTEHGFVSLFPIGDALGAVWLDGRLFSEDGHHPTNEMTVRFTTLADGPGDDIVIDERACDCCQTAVAQTARGPLLAYRDRSDGEVRDISISRMEHGRWSAPRTLHDDNWVIDACPVNGPQADADGERVAVAWFTAARDTPRVFLALSSDAGDTFSAPIRIDEGDPLGRVAVALLADGRALVVWLERTEDGADVRARLVDSAHNTGAARPIAQTAAQRPSGFPRLGRHGDHVLLAWTQPGDSSHVHAALFDFAR